MMATSLEKYAALLEKTGRIAEKAKMETRARAMRTKHPEMDDFVTDKLLVGGFMLTIAQILEVK